MKSGYSKVNGLKMYYEIHGFKGEPLVLIHGGGSSIESTYGEVIPLLADEYLVIAVELQAHGHTEDRNSPESFDQDAMDVVELLKKISVFKASFFGFSNGGNTAMKIAIRYPEMVDKLIIASSFFRREGLQSGLFEGLEKATITDMPLSLRSAFLKIKNDPDALLNMFNKDKNRMLSFKDWNEEELKSINASTLLICGDQDITKTDHVLEMSKLIQNSRLLILPATHGSYIGAAESLYSPKKIIAVTLDVIREFLNS